MSKNSKVLAGMLAASTVGAVYISSRKKAKKYGQPLNKLDISLEKIINYGSKGLDMAEKYFNKKNDVDVLLEQAEIKEQETETKTAEE